MSNPADREAVRKRLVRTIVECGVVSLFLVGGTAAAGAAVGPSVPDQINHFVTCFGLMITDPATHATECGPGQPVPREALGGGSDSGPGSVPLTTTTEPPPTTTLD